jgi:hypothetical protein
MVSAELPTDSDIDVAVGIEEAEPSLKPGKLLYRGALLEISVFPWKWFCSIAEFLVVVTTSQQDCRPIRSWREESNSTPSTE